ncbi:zinc finger protein CONSTANS-LIKE 13 [Ricinus communis]|uniref:zinc finger protein CONSTANS-LIKE 13 n=1 Tax=Ricinus communis TaxID=3988 RepID=UPI000772A914|nr:zinc finger protein CONSTANS-LIKE 13 [Ricinus communis]XP_015575620.1 zinc finger protein CONSTANS-LIKE 13 [Ricinus communis]XP_015575621.1 zinc finger protein CONSTANS-LIKE 13 [Ricinus communis]XP_048231474.1 zinc finger protein CONSTANS-LIKE 13 [Ricinus communis]|eukprot:XP_015575619.1 zinc finger protein CONSTANS-LIKE 13 [Ricinus communis]
MSDFGRTPDEQQTMMTQQHHQQERLCDYCNDTTALLYCRADSAKLCISCDREVHSTNQLFSKHTRSLLCDSCDASPASIFCETEHSVFCQNCDWEKHNLSLSSVHNRRPIEGFSGFPSVSELVSILGFEDLGDKKDKKALLFNEGDNGLASSGPDGSGFEDGYSDLLIWETPAVVSIDDLIVSSDSGPNFPALGVPPLPKNRNAVCGQHKEEILRQLRELAGLEPDPNCHNPETEPTYVFQSAAGENMQTRMTHKCCEPVARPISSPSYEENIFNWLSDNGEAGNQVSVPCTLPRSHLEESPVVPDKQSNIDGSASYANGSHEGEPQYPASTGLISVFPKVVSHDINSQERDSAISRYKEKRKTRRYDKHIRYESRKARAESRTRIRGRFAKMDR